jgi:hypothetical protein
MRKSITFLVAILFVTANYYAQELALVVDGKLGGYINKSGKMVILANYKNTIKGFHKGVARVSAKKKWRFINEKGEILGDKWFTNAELFSE